jgi:hypothetical protein
MSFNRLCILYAILTATGLGPYLEQGSHSIEERLRLKWTRQDTHVDETTPRPWPSALT